MTALDMSAKLAELDDGVLGDYLRRLNVPYDPIFKRLLLAVKPELSSATVGELLGEHLPELMNTPLIKAFVAARKKGAPSISEFATQCPHCDTFLRFDLETMLRQGGG